MHAVSAEQSEPTMTVLVYSDDVDTRSQVRLGVGRRLAKGAPDIQWVEVATHPVVVQTADAGDLDLLRAAAHCLGDPDVGRSWWCRRGPAGPLQHCVVGPPLDERLEDRDRLAEDVPARGRGDVDRDALSGKRAVARLFPPPSDGDLPGRAGLRLNCAGQGLPEEGRRAVELR